MRPITPDVLMMSPVCMFSVAMIHLLRLPPATRAMSADLCDNTDYEELYVHDVCCTDKCVLKADLTCMGRIALLRPFLQRAGLLCWVHIAIAGSQSTCIFVYGRHRCRESGFVLCGKNMTNFFHLGPIWALIYHRSSQTNTQKSSQSRMIIFPVRKL